MAVDERRVLVIGGSTDVPWTPDQSEAGLGILAACFVSDAPRAAHLGTASGDSDEKEAEVEKEFALVGAPVRHIRLFRRDQTIEQIEKTLAWANILYISSGNTANALAVWDVHRIRKLIRRAASRGLICVGSSAGAISLLQGGLTDSYGGLELITNGLGLFRGFACPHYDEVRAASFQEAIRTCSAKTPVGYGLPNGTAILFRSNRCPVGYRTKAADAPAVISPVGDQVQITSIDSIEVDELARRYQHKFAAASFG